MERSDVTIMRSTMHRFRLEAAVARDPDTQRAAQRLRYRVFGEELGARLPHAAIGVDDDHFDAFCDHLVLRDVEELPTHYDLVINTDRVGPGAAAAAIVAAATA